MKEHVIEINTADWTTRPVVPKLVARPVVKTENPKPIEQQMRMVGSNDGLCCVEGCGNLDCGKGATLFRGPRPSLCRKHYEVKLAETSSDEKRAVNSTRLVNKNTECCLEGCENLDCGKGGSLFVGSRPNLCRKHYKLKKRCSIERSIPGM